MLGVGPGPVSERGVHRHGEQLDVIPGTSGNSSRMAHSSPLHTGLKASG